MPPTWVGVKREEESDLCKFNRAAGFEGVVDSPDLVLPPPPMVVVVPGIESVARAAMRAASPPWESTIVVIQEFSGSGGRRTRVMIPGTTSEKCLDTNVEMRDDFPTPSIEQEEKQKV